MRNPLWFKLTGAFALIIFIGLIVTVWLASQGTATQFVLLSSACGQF